MGLSFDAWILHPQIGELAALADSVPETQVILDHAGRREEIFPAWAASIRELAKRDNVVVKLGGMTMRVNGFGFEQRPAPPNSEEVAAAWRPYVETCIEAFGADRCMFESNFPVDKGSQGYVVMWNACKRPARRRAERLGRRAGRRRLHLQQRWLSVPDDRGLRLAYRR